MIISKLNNLKILSFIEFSKITISISFFSIATLFAIKYMMFMFVSKFSETLHFDEHNIIEFFKRCQRVECKFYNQHINI